MYKIVTLLTLLLPLPHETTSRRTCFPNTKFLLNGRLCFCNNRGRWSEANCKTISRRQVCQPGQIIWQGCNQCICQQNGYLLCSYSHCSNDSLQVQSLQQTLATIGLLCTPFRSYYVNCTICVCPASGQTRDARCVADASCNPKSQRDLSEVTKCIPNVMYLSRCMHCLCSKQGYFDPENCEQKCNMTAKQFQSKIAARRCIAGKMYRAGCNLCRCPDSGKTDQRLCITTLCNHRSQESTLHILRSDTKSCVPHSFTTPRCLYCDCNPKGTINESACLEFDCSKTRDLNNFYTAKDSCIPGEMVPICTECFCLQDGQTNPKYCSRICSQQNKIHIIEMVLNDSKSNDHLIDKTLINKVTENKDCSPNSLYIDNGIYCLCPDKRYKELKFCTSIAEDPIVPRNPEVATKEIVIDTTAPCEPNTYIEFDCNTCYCTKNGTIDPKWCTYDDCEAKRLILESHRNYNPAIVTDKESGTCHPGSISKFECKFCICPESGILQDKVCTKNDCAQTDHSMYNDKLTCEPLTYYEVDCNICFCPRGGIKNVAKCTKNQCEKSSLRSDSCIPGQLFTDDCNLCVCPPDGDKSGKACTNRKCPEVPSWRLLSLSDSDLDNQIEVDQKRKLDMCFPGEEFADGCKLCVCPELGLKMYATCDNILCDERDRSTGAPDVMEESYNKTQNQINDKRHRRPKRSEDCYIHNVSRSAERNECTPGTMYIIRCKQCICPYMGNINNFCRPLPKNMYCEQAFPYFNYLPMGRRELEGNITRPNPDENSDTQKRNTGVQAKHDHTKYKCGKPGTIIDECFICDCQEGNVLIEEHCFKSDAEACIDARPSFLTDDKVI